MTAPTTSRPPTELAARRDDDRRRRRVRRWLGGLAFVAVAAGVVWAVWFSPLLSVRTVRVVGTTLVPADAVIAAAAVPIGTPLARIDVAEVTSRITAIPRVASVEVRRGYPQELVLAVVERVPAAAVRSRGGFDVVDADGVRFARATTAGTLPVLEVDDDTGVRSALSVLASLPAPVRATVRSVSATTRDDVSLRLRSGATVVWGDASRGERKAAVLAALLSRKASVYDVSAPDLPTTVR